VSTDVDTVSRAAVLEFAVGLAYRQPGAIVEFGVGGGDSTRAIRAAASRAEMGGAPAKRILGVDSFEGLPERFEGARPGAFACAPPTIPGVELVVGWFADVLTPQLAAGIGRVALASLDADCYSSTRSALRWLTDVVDVGSLLVFDEYLGEHGAERRAHREWQAETGVTTARLATFARGPSGWGHRPDRRVLFEVTTRCG
jgi:hypothetical protein